MTDNTIAFSMVATNAYFTLGLRFLNRFNRFYVGESKVKFYFFSDQDPTEYVPDNIDVTYKPFHHKNWLDATNSKSKLMLSLLNENEVDRSFDYLYHVDADTSISKEFDEHWLLGDMVGFKHFMSELKEPSIGKPDYGYDRNPKSSCYVPLDSPNPHRYYHACFYGGNVENMTKLCTEMVTCQEYNTSIGWEAPVNDESILNYYFHNNPPVKVVAPYADYKFNFSHKGGLPTNFLRNSFKLDESHTMVERHKSAIITDKNANWDFRAGEVVFD